MARSQRKRFFVDRQVQGALTCRVVTYVLLTMVLMALLSAMYLAILEGPLVGRQLLGQLWARLGAALVATILLIPIVVIDCIRLSNRFAGPMFRLRRAMKDVAQGKDVALVKLREGDFWYDFAEDFNQMLLERRSLELVANAEATQSEFLAIDEPLAVL